MKKINLRGEWASKRVWLNGEILSSSPSLAVAQHSPDGFNWGYGGSGPAQLALAVCIAAFGLTFRERKFGPIPFDYQAFKFKHIATLPKSDFNVDLEINVEEFIKGVRVL